MAVVSCTKFPHIYQEKLLEYALTSNPDIVCVGEMKSAEAFAAQEAAHTGHGVITTTHANSCDATYNRRWLSCNELHTLCKTKCDINDKTLYNLVTEAFKNENLSRHKISHFLV